MCVNMSAMMRNAITLTQMSNILDLSPEAYRSLRVAAQLNALGAEWFHHGRAQVWPVSALYHAALFLTLHRRLGFSAPQAARMKAKAPDMLAALMATRNGERWRFEIQYLADELEPVCDFAPWDSPRSGLHTGRPPLARTVIDLQVAWGALPEIERELLDGSREENN